MNDAVKPPGSAFEEIAFEKAHEFLAALAPASERWAPEPNDWIFRGQGDAAWKIVPSILRGRAWNAYLMPHERRMSGESEFIKASGEYEAIREFWVAVDHAGLAIPEDGQALRLRQRMDDPDDQSIAPLWPPVSLMSVVALAQHYGVPTRLVDWSWKSRVASYFATEAVAKQKEVASDGRLAVWALRANFVNENWSDEKARRVMLVTAPQATNPHLAAQAGLFTVDRTFDPPPFEEAILAKIAEVGEKRATLRKLTLPHSEARALLRLLGLDGMSAATVFPGYAGVVRSIVEKWHWDPLPLAIYRRVTEMDERTR